MGQIRIPATFMRGGSSKGVFFHSHDLPDTTAERNRVFMLTIGSPDPYGRQLNGMGGGISSLSKAVIIGQPSKQGVDVDYTFAQISITDAKVDYASNCGNLSSAVGPFAIDNGLLNANDDAREVLIHNTNSQKIIRATVPLEDGKSKINGDFEIPGVSGSGARIKLDFLDPGGTTTGQLLPTGNPVDSLTIEGIGTVEASLVDSSVPCAFVASDRIGISGTETIAELESNSTLMDSVEKIRQEAAVRMGLAATPREAPLSAPKLGVVSSPIAFKTISGQLIQPQSADLSARIWSMGQVHRVLPLTGAMCLATACRIPGTVCHSLLSETLGDVRLANPSGILPLDAKVAVKNGATTVQQVTAYRTARTLMEGYVCIPSRS